MLQKWKLDVPGVLVTRDVTICKFINTIIVTKIITVISITTVLLKCAEDVQKVPTHKSLHQIVYLKINKQLIKLLFVCTVCHGAHTRRIQEHADE